MIGTPDQVRDQYVEEWKRMPSEYVIIIYHFAQQPVDAVIENMELWMQHVKPALDELTAHFEDPGGDGA
jgi:hypothetical protein